MKTGNQSIVHVNSILSFDDIRTVQCQYEKAINGLFEAWKFGKMLTEIEAKIAENKALNYQSASGGLSRQTTEGFSPDWREGTGLKNWLSENIPTINYKTAMQFLYLFKKTSSKLPEGEESDETVARQYLEGKSQRQILRRGGNPHPLPRRTATAEALAREMRDLFSGFLAKLEQLQSIGESQKLTLDDRREIIIRLKNLARHLDEETE